jgi:hypothetical protein
MAYMPDPLLYQDKRLTPGQYTDYWHCLQRLNDAMPGYLFGADWSCEGGIRMLQYPGYVWGAKDWSFIACVLFAKLGRRLELILSVRQHMSVAGCSMNDDDPLNCPEDIE